MNLTTGQTVTTSQVGVNNVITGTYVGSDKDGFALVTWTTGAGRTVTGRFPVANTVAA